MSYTKTTWNNLSDPPISAANLNKIENQLEANSTAIDNLNALVKPTEDATTQAEITEGQITNVIGIKELILKGQTSQTGTPTPTSPIDVNVVKGTNTVKVMNKNLMELKPLTTQTVNGVTFTPVYNGNKLEYINANGTATATASYILQDANVDQASTFNNKLSAGTYTLGDFSGTSNANKAIYLRYTTDGTTFTALNSANLNTRTFTVNQECKYASFIRINAGTTVDNMKFYPQIEVGNTTTTYEAHQEKNYTITFPSSIELCKIGDYQDYIFRKDNKWYKYNAIGKIVLDGTETWAFRENLTTVSRFSTLDGIISSKPSSPCFCDRLKWYANQATNEDFAVGDNEAIHIRRSATGIGIKIKTSIASSVAELQAWLETHNLTVYYILATPVIEELTYTSIPSYLNQLYNTGLYEVSNISQEAADLPIILSIDACKDNLKGVVEYIRR